MKASYVEGLANHDGPESCGAAREGGVEALTGDVQVGYGAVNYVPGCASGRYSGMPTHGRLSEGNTGCTATARCSRIPRGQRPRAGTQAACWGTGRSHVCRQRRERQTVSGSQRTYAEEERTREVGQPHSSYELAEPSRGTGRGGEGGKGAGRGELARAQRAPDSGPGKPAQRARAGTSSSKQG